MSRRCDITGKGVLSGNLVSHSNIKTRRRFLPNIQTYTIKSYILNKEFSLDLSVKSLKTIEKNGGLDTYLINTSNSKLTEIAKKIKRQIVKAMNKQVA